MHAADPVNRTDTVISLDSIAPTEKPAFWQLYKRCYEPTIRAQFGGWSDAEHYIRFEKIWQETELRALRLNGLLIGCLGFADHPDRHELIEIQIDPDYQNQGFATQLIQWLIEGAQQVNKPLFLNVFITSPAVNLYQRLGFTIVESSAYQHRMVCGQG